MKKRPGPSETDLAERFWSKVDRRGPNDCWPWIGGLFDTGYGAFWISGMGKNVGAHRASVMLATGEWPGEWVLHRCDNPPCVNPAHLFEGDNALNVADMVAKGRSRNQYSNATHCVNGHAFAGDNLLIRKDGHRSCRACARIRQERWVMKKINSH